MPGKGKGNRWLQHLAQFRKRNIDTPPADMMREARKSYRGGGDAPSSFTSTDKFVSTPASLSGGRRQTQRRSQRQTQRRRQQSRRKRSQRR